MTQLTMISHQYQVTKSYKKRTPPPSSKGIQVYTNKTKLKKLDDQLNEIHTLNHIKILKEQVIMGEEVLLKDIILDFERILTPIKNIPIESGHISSKEWTFKRKGSAIAMSLHIPTPFLLFKDEMLDSFNGFAYKIGTTFALGFTLSFGNLNLSQLVNGVAILMFIAIFDAVLGILPNTKIKGSKAKDHTLQAKAWTFLANIIGMSVFYAIHLYLENAIVKPNILQNQLINLHIYYFVWIGVVYSHRIARYTASANNTKVPKFFSTLLNFMNKK